MENENQELSAISAGNSVSSRNSQQQLPRSASGSLISHVTDSDERARVDRQVATYGLDVLARDDRSFMDIFLELHAICARTDLDIEFIDLQEIEGRAKWLLGVSELLGVDMMGDTYTADDFMRGFRRVEEEKLQQVDVERKQELQQILQEEKARWDAAINTSNQQLGLGEGMEGKDDNLLIDPTHLSQTPAQPSQLFSKNDRQAYPSSVKSEPVLHSVSYNEQQNSRRISLTPVGLDQQFRNVLGNAQHSGLEVSNVEDGTQVQDLLSNSLNNVNITTVGADILSSSVLNSTTAGLNPRNTSMSNDYVTFDANQHNSSAGQRNTLPQWALQAQNNGHCKQNLFCKTRFQATSSNSSKLRNRIHK